MDVRQAMPEEQEAVAGLMAATFGDGLAKSLISPEFLRWKFFVPRGARSGSRSFVVSEDGVIQAHACEWPLAFWGPSGDVQSCHIIDWAARSTAKGSGLHVYQYLMKCNETVLAIGGSDQARKLLPRLHFRPHGMLDAFVRVVRPWRQFLMRPQRKDLKTLARLARNIAWTYQAVAMAGADWTVRRTANAWEVPKGALRVESSTFCLGVRTVADLQYLLECPVVDSSLYVISAAGEPRGYFLLIQISGHFRIADLAVDSEVPADWIAAFRAAAQTAAGDEACCEISAVSSIPWLSEGLREMGFRLRCQTPVMLYDPARRLLDAPSLHLRMTDSDACFLYDERNPFNT